MRIRQYLDVKRRVLVGCIFALMEHLQCTNILRRSIENTSLVGLVLVLVVYPESDDLMVAQGEHVLAAIQVVRIESEV